MEEECSSSSSDSFKEAEAGRTLPAVVEAFEELARYLETSSEDLRLEPFIFACSHVSDLFGCLGFAFKFAEVEYVSKVNDLFQASKTFDTLSNILDHDVKNDTVRKSGSHSRNLRRVKLGIDLIKALFEQFLSSEYVFRLHETARQKKLLQRLIPKFVHHTIHGQLGWRLVLVCVLFRQESSYY